MNKLKGKYIFLLSFLLMIILFYYPINEFTFRALFIVSIIFFLFNLFILYRKIFYSGIIIILSLSALFSINYGEKTDKKSFNKIYVENLKSYQGVKYVRGGENIIGIDCSGLPRKSLRDTYISLGIKTLNSKLFLVAFKSWWYDTSAKSLLDNYRNQTIKLFENKSINTIENKNLSPGDIAITSDGIHVLNYIGDNKWIEADPNYKKVIIETIPTKNIWFGIPVVILKWNLEN